ncbi:fused response regulator/phosphatase [Thiocystis violascens]|uniref:Response regulator with CheY-like receiver domain and winged-helix DNA-binding domain n=1 Tax=Thiocystis violascens (strain ATCC 17096 / DSM 198 / 6111) TaxID=765911 RepID=I3Y8B8_THIV6|nr:fused response regulator/phosphatase [Thiocystis violascens]AFL73236.1 response regulator with CheY-like receiver domain and winged-helix DNA-binding domain [Thiocystis violascens DSM 198]
MTLSELAAAPGMTLNAVAKLAPGARGCALIVDDEPSNRRLLSLMLAQEGFRTVEASDGADALRCFADERPDIVFMDIMMPEMDGFEATRAIKAMSEMDFVPVIFLTALTEEHSLMRCIQAGGDDFLSKPFSFIVLKARILAMERVRDLQRTLAAKQRALSALLEQELEEQALAERVLSRAVMNRNVAMDRLGLVQRPASIFNGDLVLTQHLPDGGLRLLVGDFTGHGLAAAIGALPVADAFHATARKGVDDAHVLAEINHKLYRILPADRFLAACLISISGNGDELRWWNGGMPSAWLRTADGLHELSSHALPLGILPELPARGSPRRIPLSRGDRLLLMSDGLLEASDDQGQMFVNAGFDEVLSNWAFDQPLLPALLAALDAHSLATEQSDDIAVVEIPLDSDLLATPNLDRDAAPGSGWRWSMELSDERLGSQPAIVAALRSLGLLDRLEAHAGALETILTELYSNALEHGVLQLDSSMKATPDGFDAYYREREQRLAAGCVGRVTLSLSYEPHAEADCVRIQVTDTGDGFSEKAVSELAPDSMRPWGRGIAMVRNLCESVVFRENGSQVEAVYRWSSEPPLSAIPIE